MMKIIKGIVNNDELKQTLKSLSVTNTQVSKELKIDELFDITRKYELDLDFVNY